MKTNNTRVEDTTTMINQIKNKLNSLYFSDYKLSEQDYKRSQRKLIISDTTAQMINAMTAGTFFIGFLNYIGISKQYHAIIGAIPQLGSFLMLFSPYLFERLKNRKLLICICCFLFRFSVSSVGFVPYITGNVTYQMILIIALYGFGYFAAGFVTPGLNNWNLDVTPVKNRGRFLAIKSTISMFSVSILTLFMGRLLDYYKLQNRARIGFNIMFGISLLLSVLDFILLSHIQEPIGKRKPIQMTLKQLILEPLMNKPFCKYIVFLSVWNFAIQISISFLSLFMLTSLNLSYSYISKVTVTANVVSMILYYLWGYMADKTSWIRVLKISSYIIALCYLGWSMITGANARVLVIILQTLLTSSTGAFHMASGTLLYDLAPIIGKTAFLGVASAISYVISFAGAVLGSVLYQYIQKLNLPISKYPMDNLQILFMISAILLMVALRFIPNQHKINNIKI